MKVLLATPSVRREAGGPAYSVPQIAHFLREAGVDAQVRAARGRLFPLQDLFRLKAVLAGVHVVHNFGAWTPFNHAVSAAARHARIPQVFCPMGMLEPWALSQKRLKKRLGWLAYQRRDIVASAALHATALAEAKNLRAIGIERPIAVIPHGIHIPPMADERPPRPRSERVAVFLSRIHPKKGLLDLVKAWALLRPADWRIIIAGPDERGHLAAVEDAVRSAGLESAFHFAGPLYGPDKEEMFASVDLFVLPSYSENFGLVVAEALAHAVPVITTTGSPWPELLETHSGWWIEPGVASLAGALAEAFSMSATDLRSMGLRGRALVAARYSWPAIIQMHQRLYEWIIGAGKRPDFLLD